MSCPTVFIATEPIVLLVAIYSSIMYGTLYALFAAFPIVFQLHRGFTPGQGGLAFVGVGLGISMGTASQTIQNRIYWQLMDRSETGRAPPEARLHMALVGGVLAPIGLWWFAWTSMPSVHWVVPIVAGIPFGIGISQILQSLTTYLMDAYTIYFASAISATVVLRSLCGAIFPLFSPALFKALGDQWAMSVFACLATLCVPIPLLFWRYGRWIRSKSHYAHKDAPSTPSDSGTNATILSSSSHTELESSSQAGLSNCSAPRLPRMQHRKFNSTSTTAHGHSNGGCGRSTEVHEEQKKVPRSGVEMEERRSRYPWVRSRVDGDEEEHSSSKDRGAASSLRYLSGSPRTSSPEAHS